jgi:hypothetical protein
VAGRSIHDLQEAERARAEHLQARLDEIRRLSRKGCMTMNAHTDLIRIPLHQLALSPRNARKTGGQDIDGLAASIAAHGLLQNLTVTYGTDDGG